MATVTPRTAQQDVRAPIDHAGRYPLGHSVPNQRFSQIMEAEAVTSPQPQIIVLGTPQAGIVSIAPRGSPDAPSR